MLAKPGASLALLISGWAFAGTHLEREAQLPNLIASLLATTVGIAILQRLKPSLTSVLT